MKNFKKHRVISKHSYTSSLRMSDNNVGITVASWDDLDRLTHSLRPLFSISSISSWFSFLSPDSSKPLLAGLSFLITLI